MMNLRTVRQRFCAGSMVIALLAGAALGLAPALVQRADAGSVLLGMYSHESVILDLNTWLAPTGKRVGISGTWVTVDNVSDVAAVLNPAWNNGYVPFVNLMTAGSTAAIANGDLDASIRSWAHQFAVWAGTGQRRAFMAPLPEMNGFWWPYSGPSPTYKQAYRRIRQIFEEELIGQGASLSAVSWVFAPNGWPGNGRDYYPGADVVDMVSINAYNFGGCPGPNAVWDTFDTAIKPYLDDLLTWPEAQGKPLFMAETGTLGLPAQGQGDKDQWLQELFTRVAAYPRFRGIVYLNLVALPESSLVNCPNGADYRLHVPGTNQWQGFWNAMASVPNYIYWAPNSHEMASIVFGRQPAQIFADVPTFHPFALEDGQVDFVPWIHALYAAGVTSGCSQNPLMYCPNDSVTRAQMAVFLLRAKHGGAYQPPVATGIFPDVPTSNPYARWVEQLAAEGITSGCGGGNFCPDGSVTREQMAVFLLKAMHGSAYQPPAATGIFGDVPPSNIFRAWIERLAAEGITGGCGGGNFCPGGLVTRTQMAVFLVRAFNLPL